MPARRERHLSLRKALYLIPDDIDPSAASATRPAEDVTTHRSSDAFSSSTPSLYASPSKACARQWIDVVLPIPGMPCGSDVLLLPSQPQCAFPSSAKHSHDIAETRLDRGTLTEMMICGTFPSSAITFNRSTVSLFPTMSSSSCGRYFSTLSISDDPICHSRG